MRSDFRSPGRRVVSFMVEWLSSWSSVLESVEWNTSRSTDSRSKVTPHANGRTLSSFYGHHSTLLGVLSVTSDINVFKPLVTEGGRGVVNSI